MYSTCMYVIVIIAIIILDHFGHYYCMCTCIHYTGNKMAIIIMFLHHNYYCHNYCDTFIQQRIAGKM